MNKDVNILYEDDEYYYISFENEDFECKYFIVGMDDIFNYHNILITDDNYAILKKEDVLKYSNIRVNYVIRNDILKKDILVGNSNDLVFTRYDFECIDVKWIESYIGMTMSFISDFIYDKYYVYEKVHGNYELVCETEDFQVTLDSFKKGSYYYVEGYKKDGSGYRLSGISKRVKCECIHYNFGEKNLSIVVPIYNSEKFLCRCIDSVLLSSYKDIELILVDDGSSDKSSEIVDWYHEKYGEMVKVIHKGNQGLAFARNDGIKIAEGDYIAFLDSDDFVHHFMYERLYRAASLENLDVVIGKAIIRNTVGNYNICLDINAGGEKTLIYDYESMLSNKIDNNYENIFFVAVWNKIIKTDIVKSHPFPMENLYEDTAFTKMIYSYVDRFGFVKDAYYVWDKRQRKTVGTLTSTYDGKDVFLRHEKYCEAMIYSVYYGNEKRLDLLIYDAVKELIDYVKKVNVFGKNDDKVFKIYKEAILRVDRDFNVRNNDYIKIDKVLYDDVMSILR